MRVWGPVFLSAILLLNSFGFYVSFFVNRQCIKSEMALLLKNTPAGNLKQFEFSLADYNKLERPEGDNAEVLINGELYDVKNTELNAGRVILYAEKDTAEFSLTDSFIRAIRNQSASHTNSGNSLLKVLQQDFVAPGYSFQMAFVETKSNYHLVNYSVLVCPLSPASPPPPDCC